MAQAVDLNQLRQTIITNQDSEVPTPTQQSRKVFVDNQGNIMIGNDAASTESKKLSEVNQGTFYVKE